MLCPKCKKINKQNAKFCKNCGAPLTNSGSLAYNDLNQNDNNFSSQHNNETFSNQNKPNEEKNTNKNILIICITIIVCILIVTATFMFINNNNSNNTTPINNSGDLFDSPNNSNTLNTSDDTKNTSDESSSTNSNSNSNSLHISSGSITTGHSLEDKTYCSVYLGKEHAGENVKISVLYSRDGSNLNSGNIVPKQVNSDGTVEVPSASAFSKYPDTAIISIYDSNGNLKDTVTVNLETEDGTQYF